MASAEFAASIVLDKAASLLNDTARTVYTRDATLPYLQMALQELQEYYELHSIPVTEEVSTVIPVDAGTTQIVFNGVPGYSLPIDMVEPVQLWERARGVDPYLPMTKKDFLPGTWEGVESTQFIFYAWQTQRIKFPPASRDNDIKIDYIRELFTDITATDSQINVINARSFLEYRTAALCAEFIERNLSSSASLNTNAILALDRATGIGVRGKQNIMTRRRPFRASYKARGGVS